MAVDKGYRHSLSGDGKHLYQWTAIDECARYRYIFGYEEHIPENSLDFLNRLQKVFPFKIQKPFPPTAASNLDMPYLVASSFLFYCQMGHIN